MWKQLLMKKPSAFDWCCLYHRSLHGFFRQINSLIARTVWSERKMAFCRVSTSFYGSSALSPWVITSNKCLTKKNFCLKGTNTLKLSLIRKDTFWMADGQKGKKIWMKTNLIISWLKHNFTKTSQQNWIQITRLAKIFWYLLQELAEIFGIGLWSTLFKMYKYSCWFW